MPVLYNSVPLVPAPFLTISKQEEVGNDGTNLGATYQITLKGNLVAEPPGGSSVDADARLGVLLTKQKNLSDLFSVDGKVFEVYSPDGTAVTQCNPIVRSIEFAEGIWVERTEYTIVLESPTLFADDILPADFVSDITDRWEIEEAGYTFNDEGTLKPVWQMTRTVSAKGKLIYDEVGLITAKPWERARSWVVSRIASSAYPFDAVNELSIKEDSSTAYNHKRTESVDVIEGTFSVTEIWTLAYDLPVVEDYTMSVRYTPEDPVDTTVNITGTIKGLSTGINQLHTRLANATSYWENVVKDDLYNRAASLVPGVSLSVYGVSGNVDYNAAEGQITYNYDFSTKALAGDGNAYDTYVVSKKYDIGTPEITVSVQGTVTGRLLVGEANTNLVRYQRAKAYFDTINNSTTMLARALQSGVGDLKEASVSTSSDFHIFDGTIEYTFEFNNRPDSNVRNEYTMSLRTTREDGKSVVTVDGTITGLRESESDPFSAKYVNAVNFYNGWISGVPALATNFIPGATLNPNPVSTSRGDAVYQGVITYSLEYDTTAIPTIPGAVYQKVSFAYDNGGPVFAVIDIIGQGLPPVFQDINARKAKSKTLNLEAVMDVGFGEPDTEDLVESHQPDSAEWFVESDNKTWDETDRRYTRTVTWKIRQ